MWQNVFEFPRKHLILTILFVLFLSTAITYTFSQSFLPTSQLTRETYQIVHRNSNDFSLYVPQGYLYKSTQLHEAAAVDFLRANPGKFLAGKLLPSNFVDQAVLQRSVVDTTGQFMKPNTEHYFFQQTVDNVPVYGAIVAVHIQNADEIYAASGAVVSNTRVPTAKIDLQQIQRIALAQAEKDAGITNVNIAEHQEYILNLQSLGISSDATTYDVQAILINSQQTPITFSKRYFVDTNTGKIVYTESLIEQLLQRDVYNCHDSSNCDLERKEGEQAVSDTDVNKLYSIFGDIYNYYYQNFGRDSFDNHGAPLNGYVHRSDIASYACPNAAYVSGQMQVCDNLVVPDIIMHEMTHALTQHTAQLLYFGQSGALNESNSDIFATVIDHNWTIGEDIHVPGVTTPFRFLNDPTKTGQPDKLFSSNYVCSQDDNQGIHTNMGIMNKAFYLMTQGGDFNGCHVNGVGNASYAIEYRTLTHYLIPSANFSDMYIDFLLACNDLYDANSPTCLNVKAALQAVEIDQQPNNEQTGPVCSKETETPPACRTEVLPTLIPTRSATENSQLLLPGNCHVDPNCEKAGGNIQMCVLVCK